MYAGRSNRPNRPGEDNRSTAQNKYNIGIIRLWCTVLCARLITRSDLFAPFFLLFSFCLGSDWLSDIHESDDDTQVAIPFTVYACEDEKVYCNEYDETAYSGLTSPGTALGEGEQLDVLASIPPALTIMLLFDLTNGQWIRISEVRCWVLTDVTVAQECW